MDYKDARIQALEKKVKQLEKELAKLKDKQWREDNF